MITITRCQEAYEEAFKLVEGKLQILENQISDQEILDFKDQVAGI